MNLKTKIGFALIEAQNISIKKQIRSKKKSDNKQKNAKCRLYIESERTALYIINESTKLTYTKLEIFEFFFVFYRLLQRNLFHVSLFELFNG